MEAQKKRNSSDSDGEPSKKKSDENLANSANKGTKSDESSDPHGNLGIPLKKKQKNFDDSSKKANLYNQITIREADKPQQRFNLSRCQLNEKSALSPHRRCKAKSVVGLSNNIGEHMDIADQGIGVFREEIIMEILSRLPVRSLHQFKCVSKSWKALISDPYFKKKHLDRAKNEQNFQKLLAAKVCPDEGGEWSFYNYSLLSIPLVEDEQKLEFPLNLRRGSCTMLCSCDGLVLLAVYDKIDDDGIDEHLLLWNPSTRESRLLPHPKPRLRGCVCGLGYDTSSDDYKILTVDLNACDPRISSEILALKRGSWRSLKYPTDIYRVSCPMGYNMDSLAFVHGTFHWLGDERKEYNLYTIITFDISNEVYGEIPLPEEMCNILDRMREHGVSELGGMLCTYASSDRQKGAAGGVWVWVMKEYGVKESWTVLFNIQESYVLYWARPKYMYADGEVLLNCLHKRALRSMLRRCSVFKRSKGPPYESFWPSELILEQGSGVYTETLISP